MRLSRKILTTISAVIIGISAVVWLLLLVNPGEIMTIEHCHVSDAGPSAASLEMLLEMNPPSSLILGWGLMVVAMMLPKLIIPIQIIYMQSFKRLWFPSALLFVSGYIAVWMIAGVVSTAIILGLHLVMPNSYLPALGVVIIAVIWQFSPIKQKCLNKGHDHWILAAFGWAAMRDAVLFGVMHGVWCVGAGWALMLFPMLLPEGHNAAMIFVTYIMLSEHLEHPQVPRWRIDFRTRLFRYVVVQIRIRLKNVFA